MSGETKTPQDEALTVDEVRSIINARFNKDTFNDEIQTHEALVGTKHFNKYKRATDAYSVGQDNIYIYK